VSAQILREAAALMRSRAEAVATPEGDALTESWADASREFIPGADGEHVASWHPAVALAVADWLDECADDYGRGFGTPDAHALAVATAYLGGAA